MSFAVIGLCLNASADFQDKKRLVEKLLPGGQLEGQSIVGCGIALSIACINIIIFSFWNSLYILKDKCPQAIRKRFPEAFSSKAMSAALFHATGRAHASSTLLPDETVERMVEFSGESLEFKDRVIVVDYTVISWIIWLTLIAGICLEISKFSRAEYGETEKERPRA
ncbi:hypothetical protein PSHT_09676 [Puccinia striiformis]|uniref:Uncharacterized protein n=1 Tax=Puccinia striiformis TaxID=27350 RepID=A0A2S4VF94_9BASI|nr:hypothetical protein PSHT_09676 [Puccinia striiformis]